MGSPITFSGFNKIDFNLILNSIIEQERAPIRALEAQQRSLQVQNSSFGTLASKLGALETAAGDLADSETFGGRTVTNSSSTNLTVAATASAALGTYDIKVNELARAQVTGSTSAHADADTTVVATGGTLTIGGVAVTISNSVTLEGLAAAINSKDGIGVTATIVSPAAGSYQIVLTGKNTGATNSFTIQNALAGGSGITFLDTNDDGSSGDSEADNAVNATDAEVVVNNITVTSESNTIDTAIAGATITLLKKDPATTVTVTIGSDLESTKGYIQSLVTAYNELVNFAKQQTSAASRGETTSIGRDPLLRGLESTLSSVLSAEYEVGGTFTSLSEVGLGFSVTGELTFDSAVFDAAATTSTSNISALFTGGGGVTGAFAALQDSIKDYTDAGGLIPDLKERLTKQLAALGNRIDDFEQRLSTRRNALQQEFIATDLAITRMNSQLASLQGLGSQFRLF
jgi:flagellar hook-associated protein 2